MKRHGAAALLFAALAIVWTYPLVTDLSGLVPGAGPGDTLQFLWNFWWMRTALASGLDVFHTSFMFAPVGSSLVLHTLTPLPAFVAAELLSPLSAAAGMNVTILASLSLNGFCAYLLALRLGADRAGGIIGGLVFGGSSYLFAHLHGHFNLTTAWTIPLFALLAIRAMRGGVIWAMAAGLVLGATAYIDYYYLVYESALAVLIAATTSFEWSISSAGPGSRVRVLASRAVMVLIAAVGVLAAAILVTTGFSVDIGPQTISARSLVNPLQIFWLLVALWLWLRFHPRILLKRIAQPAAALKAVAIMFVMMLFVAAPVVRSAAGLIASGDYVTQKYFWRSAPNGIDLGTLLMGPPFHGLVGEQVRAIYGAIGIPRIEDVIEAAGWLGILPVLLAFGALRRHRDLQSVRQWAAIGGIFFVWALGPHLTIFGRNTAMILPQALLRFVPIVNNARYPGRAMAVVTLAVAMLAAVFVSRWRPASGRRSLAIAGLAIFTIVESLPAPFPMVHLSAPRFYEALRDRPEAGAVCELPLGIRDGFGGRGRLDEMQFYYQTIHKRPLVGGYLSRMSTSIVTTYAQDPLLDGLLDLSEPDSPETPRSLPDARLAFERLRANGIAFVVLDRAASSPGLIEYVETVLPLDFIATEGDRTLYVVKKWPAG